MCKTLFGEFPSRTFTGAVLGVYESALDRATGILRYVGGSYGSGECGFKRVFCLGGKWRCYSDFCMKWILNVRVAVIVSEWSYFVLYSFCFMLTVVCFSSRLQL